MDLDSSLECFEVEGGMDEEDLGVVGGVVLLCALVECEELGGLRSLSFSLSGVLGLDEFFELGASFLWL